LLAVYELSVASKNSIADMSSVWKNDGSNMVRVSKAVYCWLLMLNYCILEQSAAGSDVIITTFTINNL